MRNGFKQRFTIWSNNQRLRVTRLIQWMKSLNLGVRTKNVGLWLWKAMGSPHFANLLSLATLAVTVYLTLYVFEYTQNQEESLVEISIGLVPRYNPPTTTDYSRIDENEWMINISMHNSGPSDIQTSSFIIQIQDNPSIKLIGFDQKSWLAMVNESQWLDPAPTPYAADNLDYLTVLSNFERGGNYSARLVFEVTGELNAELLEKWNSLGIKKITDPIGGGHYYDRGDIDHNAYIQLLQYFLGHVGLTGQNVYTYGDVP